MASTDLNFNGVTYNGAKLGSHGACGVPAHETPFMVEMSFDNMGVPPDNASLIVVIFQAHGAAGAQDFVMTRIEAVRGTLAKPGTIVVACK
jgi:hypothetical protein